MPQDYKHRARPHAKNKRAAPCWLWFFSGMSIGLFAAGLAWLKLSPGAPGGPVPIPGFSQASAEKREPQRAAEAPAPRFDFYTILPEMEVVIPEADMQPPPPRKTPPAEKRVETPTAPSGDAYLLQVGSFRSHADADRLRARLALLGMEAEIQKVTINNRDTYHR